MNIQFSNNSYKRKVCIFINMTNNNTTIYLLVGCISEITLYRIIAKFA